MVGGEAAGAGVLAGENGCGVSVCWYLIIDCRFQKKLEIPDMLCWLSLPVGEALHLVSK